MHQRKYHYLPHYKDGVDERIKDLSNSGLIVLSDSYLNKPLRVVPKKNDNKKIVSRRIVSDNRALKTNNFSDNYPSSMISKILLT